MVMSPQTALPPQLTVPAGPQPEKLEKLLKSSEVPKALRLAWVRIVALAPVPAKMARKGSVPPGAITFPAALVPPPKPNVWRPIVAVEVKVKVVSKGVWGEVRVPVNERLFALATPPHSAKTHNNISHRVLGMVFPLLSCADRWG